MYFVPVDPSIRHLGNGAELTDLGCRVLSIWGAGFIRKTQASLRLAMSAQIPEAYMALRGSLESGLYAYRVHRHPQLKPIWLNRCADPNAKKAAKNAFKMIDVHADLDAGDQALGANARRLYEVTIDEGAHPNVNTFLANSLQQNDATTITLALTYLNPDELHNCLNHAVEIANCVLAIFKLIFGEHCA